MVAKEISLYLGMVSGLSSFMISAFQIFKKDNNFALFSVAFYTNETPMAIVGLNKKVLYANPALERLLGYSENELRKMEFTKFTHPDFIDGDVELFMELVAGTRDRYQFRKKWIPKMAPGFVSGILSASAIRDMERKDGSLIGVFAMITPLDVTDSRIERAVQKTLDRMENESPKKDGILSQVVDGLSRMDKMEKPIRIVLLFTVLAGTLYMFFFGGADDLMEKVLEAIKLILDK